jgi:prepilin-type N-terminal cleavage/methylation domain-containing protein
MRRFIYIFRRRGLTLIETLTVMFIVSILAGFAVGLARHAHAAAARRRAQADLHLLADALERHQLRFGDLPGEPDVWQPATNLLAVITPLPDGQPPDFAFQRTLPEGFTALDPWGASYRYRYAVSAVPGDPTAAVAAFELRSSGPDGKER